MKAHTYSPPLFHLKIPGDACQEFIQLATYFHQLRVIPIFLEACNTKIKVAPYMPNVDNIVTLSILR